MDRYSVTLNIRRSMKLLERTDIARLPPEERTRADHARRWGGAMLLAERAEQRRFKVVIPTDTQKTATG